MIKRLKILVSSILVLIVTMSCIAPAFAEAAEPKWTQVASMADARSEFSAAEVNGKIYVFGGKGLQLNLNTVEEYDPSTNIWATKAPLPKQCYITEVVVIDGKIYIVDGGKNPNNSVDIYDPATDTWTTTIHTTGRLNHQVATANGKLYVIGGRDSQGNILTSVEEYDPSTGIWTTSSMKTPRWNFKVAVVNGKIYAIGGQTTYSYPKATTNSIEEYDPMTRKWTVKASMNVVNYNNELAVINNKIYVVGGGNDTKYTSSVGVYDPEIDTWTTKAPMSTARMYHKLEVINNNIYALGGQPTSGGVNLSSMEQYNPETNTWTTKSSVETGRSSFQTVTLNGDIYVIGGSDSYATSLSSVEKYSLTSNTPTGSTSLTAIGGNSKIDLSWGAVTDATSYNVYRSTTSGGPYTQIASGVSGTVYIDTGVTNGTIYYYVVTAVSAGGESAYSNEASATPQAATTGRALLEIKMVTGVEKEYDLTMAEVNIFIAWYDGRAVGTGNAYYVFDKNYNLGPFGARKDYIVFDKISDFEVMQYEG